MPTLTTETIISQNKKCSIKHVFSIIYIDHVSTLGQFEQCSVIHQVILKIYISALDQILPVQLHDEKKSIILVFLSQEIMMIVMVEIS